MRVTQPKLANANWPYEQTFGDQWPWALGCWALGCLGTWLPGHSGAGHSVAQQTKASTLQNNLNFF